ncbi:MAG: hypothetical protein ABEK59_06705 [Halobacteria archaeon]
MVGSNSDDGGDYSDKVPRTQVIEQLSEGPKTDQELEGKISPKSRKMVGKLDVPTKGTGGGKSRGRTQTVYYLYGDERRAVRKYIRVNEEFVKSCMQDEVNPINVNMEDYWWQMFVEEWVYQGKEDTL